MEVGSKASPAGNAVKYDIVNQHQETVNAVSEMSAVDEQATKLKGLKILKNSDEKNKLKIADNKEGEKNTTAKIAENKDSKKTATAKIAENKDGKKTATAQIAENKDGKETATAQIAENKDGKKTATAQIAENKDGQKTTIANIVENKDAKKTTAAMTKANKRELHESSKAKDGKEELSKTQLEILTAMELLDNPHGSSEDEIINFMISQHIQHGSFPAFFDEVCLNGKDEK